jgi:lipoate-protein ligase B
MKTSSDPNGPCAAFDLGTVRVPEAEDLMQGLAELRIKDHIPDVVLLLRHPPTVALGLKDRDGSLSKHLRVSLEELDAEGIELTRSVRGGGITYHWPGQVVCYPVLALGPAERDVPGYMRNLEEVGIRVLNRFGLEATRRRDAAAYVGLWVGDKKIASMGIRVSKWVTSFGFALNVEGDHGPSRWISPCGLDGVELVTMEEILVQAVPRDAVATEVLRAFEEVFHRKVAWGTPSSLPVRREAGRPPRMTESNEPEIDRAILESRRSWEYG